MQTTLRNNCMTVLKNVLKFVHPSIQIKHKKVLKSIYCSQVPINPLTPCVPLDSLYILLQNFIEPTHFTPVSAKIILII